eukprot:scaffold1181_cov152-Amphora_coffeaeformis.AAC.12
MPNSHNKQRRKVLTEEEYNESLSRVVQRNYFPDLPHLADTASLVERRAAGDIAGAVAIRRAMRQRQDTEEREVEEQAAAEQGVGAVRSTPRPLHHESLTNFHARVTSEDNAEFAQQQANEVEAIRKRQRFEYGTWARLTNGAATTDPIQALPPSTSHVASPLPLASDQFNATPHRKSVQQLAQAAADNTQTNGLFFVPGASAASGWKNPQPLPLALPPSATTSTLSNHDQQNTAMPPPTRQGSKNQISSLSSLVEYIPKEKDTMKRIEPAATRFSSSFSSLVRVGGMGGTLTQYRGNRGLNLEESDTDSEVASVDYASATDASTDLDAPPLFDLATELRLGQRRKRQELEKLVQMTPVIVPGKSGGDGSDEPLMTWGEVSATPLVLSGRGDDDESLSGPAFDVAENARDAAAERARQRMEQRSRLASSATPRRTRSLKRPASIFGTRPASARSAGSFGTALRSSYGGGGSSSARRSGGGTSSIRYSGARPAAHVHRATPKIVSLSGRTLSVSSSSSTAKSSKDVTKGLLQLS